MVKIQVGHQAACSLVLWAALGFPSALVLPAPSCLTHSLGLSCCAFSKGGCRPARWQDEITLAYDGRFGVNNCYKSRGRRAGLAPLLSEEAVAARPNGAFCSVMRPVLQRKTPPPAMRCGTGSCWKGRGLRNAFTKVRSCRGPGGCRRGCPPRPQCPRRGV